MTTPHDRELRRSRRLDVSQLVAGQFLSSGAPVKIRDIGFGGFAMETSFRIRVGSTHDFRFTSRNGASFTLKAKVVHSRRAAQPVGPVAYWTGLEFVDADVPGGQRAIDLLTEKVNWILSFYHDSRQQRASPRT